MVGMYSPSHMEKLALNWLCFFGRPCFGARMGENWVCFAYFCNRGFRGLFGLTRIFKSSIWANVEYVFRAPHASKGQSVALSYTAPLQSRLCGFAHWPGRWFTFERTIGGMFGPPDLLWSMSIIPHFFQMSSGCQ